MYHAGFFPFFVLFIPHLDNGSKVVVWKELVSVSIQVSAHEYYDEKSTSVEADWLVGWLVGSESFKVSCSFQVWLSNSLILDSSQHNTPHAPSDRLWRGQLTSGYLSHLLVLTMFCPISEKKVSWTTPSICCASLCLRLKAQPLHPGEQQARLLKSIIVSHNDSLFVDVAKLDKSIKSGSVHSPYIALCAAGTFTL